MAVEKKKYVNEVRYNNRINSMEFGKFTKVDHDVFFAILSRLRHHKEDELVATMEFDYLRKLMEFKGNSLKRFTQELYRINDKIFEAAIQFDNGAETGSGDYVGGKARIFTDFVINERKQTLEIAMSPRIVPLLTKFANGQFTEFELSEFLQLRSTYSKALYLNLKQYKSMGLYVVTIEEFREKLGIPDSYAMRNINQRVLAPIQKELSECFKGLTITKLKHSGSGNRVTALRFSFQKQNSMYSGRKEVAADELPSLVELEKMASAVKSRAEYLKIMKLYDRLLEVNQGKPQYDLIDFKKASFHDINRREYGKKGEVL